MDDFPTYALIIGVSHYEEPSLDDLPGAENDAIRFAQALINWGIPKEQIRLNIGASGTYRAIVDILEEFRAFSFSFRLVLFFSGHGLRFNDPSPQSFLLVSDSLLEIKEQRFKRAFPLDRLVALLGEMNAIASFFFLDACELRINALSHPISLNEVSLDRKSLFCLLSSGIGESYESVENNSGYFTTIILEALAEFKQPTATEFVETLRRKAVQLDIFPPEMYNIETQYISFLKTKVPRHDRRLSIFQDHLFETTRFPMGLIGAPGIGKTTFALNIAKQNIGCVYIAIPRDLRELRNKLVEEFQLESQEESPFIEIEKKFPWTILFLDNFSADWPDAPKLLKLLEHCRLRVVLIHLGPPHPFLNSQWSFSPMNRGQMLDLIKAQFPDCPENHAAILIDSSKGNPRRLREIAQYLPRFLSEAERNVALRDLIGSIHAAGGFLDLDHFCQFLHQPKEKLQELIERGIVYRSDRKWKIHPLIAVELKIQVESIEKKKALEYWLFETKKNPRFFEPNHPLIKLLTKNGIPKKVDSFLHFYFGKLVEHESQNFSLLAQLADLFLTHNSTHEVGIALAAELLKYPEGVKKAESLAEIHLDKLKTRKRGRLIKACSMRRAGKWSEVIEWIRGVSKRNPISSRDPFLTFELGCSLIARGNLWDAKKTFEMISTKRFPAHLLRYCRCMRGTIAGLMGENKEAEQLLLGGIELLEGTENPEDAWLGYNNLSEIYLYAGQRAQARTAVLKALQLSQGKEEILETKRILLTWNLCYGQETGEISSYFESIDFDQFDPFLSASIENTLAWNYLILGEVNRAKELLSKAFSRFGGNGLTTVLSLGLESHVRMCEGDESGSLRCLSTAHSLAREQGNQIAHKQLKYLKSTLEKNRERI